ncbi:MAG: hypothetical protein JRZ95_05230 [Nitrososphaerota archaeon]|nr:hypothetical protein [Nitrososphaerota archaeon]
MIEMKVESKGTPKTIAAGSDFSSELVIIGLLFMYKSRKLIIKHQLDSKFTA